jgi:hypothetical protein
MAFLLLCIFIYLFISAAAAGWPYIIMSDTLCVRDYIGNQGFKPQVAVPVSTFASYPGA